MDDGGDAMPFDHTYLDKDAGHIGPDEHGHRVVLHEMPDRESERVEHCRIRNTMPVGTVEDDRLKLHTNKVTWRK